MPIDVKMPRLGESVVEGTVGRWLKRPGDTVKRHEALLEVTTDKVDTEVPSTIDGRVLELLVPEGETVQVGTVIARLAEVGEQRQATDRASTATEGEPRFAPPISPVVARLAAEHGIDLAHISGTGANGRITKKDVEHYLAPDETPPGTADSGAGRRQASSERLAVASGQTVEETPDHAPLLLDSARIEGMRPAGDELVPLSPMRRAIADHLVRSRHTAPHVTTVMEVDLSRVSAHRERVKADFERQGAHLTFTPYFVLAAVAALRALPIINASFRDDGIQMHARIHIGVAVALPDGLIVPVIKDADERSLLGLAREVGDLAERARSRRLRPDDIEGGTFTITNHGVSGSIFATPIINQPQAAILGIGAIEKRAVVISEGDLDAIAIRLRCYLSLTFDHRLIDGATADHFLQVMKQSIENYGA